jgi:hypothetical protein
MQTWYNVFRKGELKELSKGKICGVGYLGEGEYKSRENGSKTRAYSMWYSMIRRCYSYRNETGKGESSYYNCEVCEEWHNFQNFAKWFNENYYEVHGELMTLDKDILVHNNKIYSPQTCLIVPNSINCLFIK